MSVPRHVYRWGNGMVMVFDADDRQIPELQGEFEEVAERIYAAADRHTQYHGLVTPREWKGKAMNQTVDHKPPEESTLTQSHPWLWEFIDEGDAIYVEAHTMREAIAIFEKEYYGEGAKLEVGPDSCRWVPTQFPVFRRKDTERAASLDTTQIGLGRRYVKVLRRAGVTSVAELLAHSVHSLEVLPGVGKTAIREIRTRLRVHGLYLMGDKDGQP